jgi:feruloyl esterase
MLGKEPAMPRGTTTLLALLAIASVAPGTVRAAVPQVTARQVAAPIILPEVDCVALAGSGVFDPTRIPGAPTHISSARALPANGRHPAYCDVQGYVTPQVHFDLKLPTASYQGRYLQLGCAGFCGAVLPPFYPGQSGGRLFPHCDAQLGGDFAVATSDQGHSGTSLTDARWAAGDEQLRNDFAYRAAHVVSIAAKAIITAYYAAPPSHAYFAGCSEGGREALIEAQRYPTDFEGIIAGAPAATFGPLLGEFLPWVAAKNTNPDGSAILTADKLPALHAAVIAACDGADGATDGLIRDPSICRFDPARLACPTGTDAATCLTAAQVAAVRALYSGPVDASGERLFPGGEPYGSELAWGRWFAPPPGVPMAATLAAAFGQGYLQFMGFPIGSPTSSIANWTFDVHGFRRLIPESMRYDALDPDLSAFQQAGGKLILYQGWADQVVSPYSTIDYYAMLSRRMGGLDSTQRFARLFLLPSVYHCFGSYGPFRFSLIDRLVTWVEDGTAPSQVVVSGGGPGTPRHETVRPYPDGASGDLGGALPDETRWVGSRELYVSGPR